MAHTLDRLVATIRESGIDLGYRLCALAVHEASSSAQESWAKPISKIQFDDDNAECLLVVGEPKFQSTGAMPDSGILTASMLVATSRTRKPRGHFVVCVSEGSSQEDTFIRVDYPVIGTGENHERQRFFAVVRSEP